MQFKKPKIRNHILVVPFNNKVSVGNTYQSAIEIEDETGVIKEILFLCDGINTIDDIYTEVIRKGYTVSKDEVVELLDRLSCYPYIMEEGLVLSDIPQKLLERYSRNLNFLSNFDKWGDKKFDYLFKIINSTILVLGIGGVGSPIVYDLAALGVKKIVAIDFDIVDETNLNRQILYREKHIGMKKIYAAKETVNEFNSHVEFVGLDMKINSTDDLEEILESYRPMCVVCSADKPPVKIYKWVNEACVKRNIPYIYGGNTETTAFFQTVVPHNSSCFECYEHHLKNNFNKEGYAKYVSIMENNYSSQNNCTAASSSALASFMIFDFIRLITGFEKPLSLNRRMFIDFKTNEIDSEYIPVNQNCNICSKSNKLKKEV